MEKNRIKLVRVRAVHKRYINGATFWAMPFEDTATDNYVTGQEYSDDRKDGLTRAQIEGTDPLSASQKKKYRHVIRVTPSFRGVPISRSKTFDLSTNENGEYVNIVDVVHHEYFKSSYTDYVAPNESSVKVGKHLFHLVDEENTADVKNKLRKLKRETENQVFDKLDESNFHELLLYVNYHKGTTYNVGDGYSPELRLNDIYESVDKHFEVIDNFFSENGNKELFVLKLHMHGILKRTNNSYSTASGKYIGDSVMDVLKYMEKSNNDIMTSSWFAALVKADVNFAKEMEAKKNAIENEGDK